MAELVTVIVPVYNTERFLRKCVDSILSQSYREIELFLVNDGSKDSSSSICDEYARIDTRVHVIHKENEGQAIARNCALDKMTGKFVMFVDSDDYLPEGAVSMMVACIERNCADIAFCYASFDNGIKLTDSYRAYAKETVFESAAELLTEYFTPKRIQSAPWGKLFKSELWTDIRFPPYRAREDYAIMHELFGKTKRSVHSAEVGYIQYVRPGSTEYSPFNPNKLRVVDCDLAIKKYVKENFPELYGGAMVTYADSLRNCMADICRSFKKRKYKKIYNDLREALEKEIYELLAEDETLNLSSHIFAVKHPARFSFKHHFDGAKNAVKCKIKKVVYKGRGQWKTIF